MIRRNFKRFFAAKNAGLPDTGNPLFPRPTQSRKYWWWGMVSVMLLTLVVTGVTALMYGPFLDLQTITIKGTTTLSPDHISAAIRQEFALRNSLIFPNKHRWFFNEARAESELMSAFPLKSVSVARVGSGLQIDVTEDVFMVALRSGEEVYFLNPQGAVLRVATPEEKAAVLVKLGVVPAPADGQTALAVLQPDMPTIQDKLAVPRASGDQLFNAEVIANLIAFNQGLRTQGIKVKEFESDNVSLPWFSVTSDRPYLILFDAEKDPAQQLAVLQAVATELSASGEETRYIDVRFGTRVYVR